MFDIVLIAFSQGIGFSLVLTLSAHIIKIVKRYYLVDLFNRKGCFQLLLYPIESGRMKRILTIRRCKSF